MAVHISLLRDCSSYRATNVNCSGSRTIGGVQRLQSQVRASKRQRVKEGIQCTSSTEVKSVEPKLVQLGGSDLQVSRLGIGTLQWGDPGTGWGTQYEEAQLQEVFNTALAGGVNFFDTAEVYGYQGIKTDTSSEQLLGRFLQDAADGPQPIVLGTKFFTIPWTNMLVGGGFRLGRQSMIDALRASLTRLQLKQVDLYQVHFPFPSFSQKVLGEGLAEAMDLGLVKAVGVCNYDSKQLGEIHAVLAARGIPLASNQVKYNILERDPEKSGLLAKCKDLNVTVVAHSPLQQGLLTGKFVESGGGEKADKIRPLLKLMALVGTFSGGKSISQIALAYLMAKGAIPIPGCKTVAQAKEHLGALSFALDENEVGMIDERVDAL